MKHIMNLAPQPFEAIAEGKKTVEMRLNDERRATLRVGDGIEFENIETLDKVVCKVVNITRFNDFFELYSHFDKTLIGYSESEIADPADMYQNYTAEKIAQYGVLAIEIILI